MIAKKKEAKSSRRKRSPTATTARKTTQRTTPQRTSRLLPEIQPKLRFTPTAWAKLLFLRDCGQTEVGGFGICPNGPLLVEDVILVRQRCTMASVEFDDESVADFFDAQIDAGLRPEQFARVWIHTHPGDSSYPSSTDEDTLTRVFGQSNWAVMFILACGGDTYTRLRFNVGPQADVLLETAVDYKVPFDGSDSETWRDEYDENVNRKDQNALSSTMIEADELYEEWEDAYHQLLTMEEEAAYGYLE